MAQKLTSSVLVSVYQNEKCQASKKAIFCRHLYLQDGESFPYSLILCALRVLFGTGCVVVFEDSPLE